MAELDNERHERFANLYVKMGNQTRAYMKVYPDSSYESAAVSAHQLLKNPKVKARVKELNTRTNAEVMNAVGLTKEKLLKMALEVYNDARDAEHTEVARKTVEMIGRDQGMFVPSSSQRIESKEETTVFTVSMGKDLKEDDDV